MELRCHNTFQWGRTRGIARLQLGFEVRPFVSDLTGRHRQRLDRIGVSYLARVEAIAATGRFSVDVLEIGGDVVFRRRRLPEADKLWVIPVPTRPARQHRLRQQALTPYGNQSPGVEILRM